MQKGTPEQGRQIRHRRNVWVLACFIAVVVFGASAVLVNRPGYIFLVGFPLAIGLLVFGLSYWRCPVCQQHFPRGSGGRYCENCKTTFDA
jgi:hypothetical protein